VKLFGQVLHVDGGLVILQPVKWPGNVFGLVCLCMRVSVCNVLPFESLDLESSLLLC